MKPFYTLEDLESREKLDRGCTVPARLAVIGCPIAHSKSPQMQNAALKAMGLGEKMRYIRLQLQPDELAVGLARLQDLGFLGCNVTVPYKTQAFELADECDGFSQKVGAVNTLRFLDGQVRGSNTDGPGFVAAIRQQFSLDVGDLKIVLLGAGGGAGLAVAHACVAAGCEQLVLVNRTVSKTMALAKTLRGEFSEETRLSAISERLSVIGFEEKVKLEAAVKEADLIVNATSLGLSSLDESPLPASFLLPSHVIFDLITHSTKLLEEGEARGARVSDGCSMLVAQGALSLASWVGRKPDVWVMEKALREESSFV